MTRKESERREKAAIAVFVDRNPELAYKYVMQIIEYNAKETVFRFRPPLDREVDILKEKKIFLCKPREYKDDGDNAMQYFNAYRDNSGITSDRFVRILDLRERNF